jgi:hypothetical protein
MPTASIFTESFEEIFLPNGASLPNSAHKSVPFPVPIFGVNICPFNYGIKVIFILELTIMLNVSELNLFNTRSFLLQSIGVFAQIQTLVHQSLKLKSLNGGPRPSSSGKSHSLKTHSVLLFRFPS